MEKEEIRERLNRPRVLLLVDLGFTMLEKALELGHVISCDEFQLCRWCDYCYDWDDEECKDHADDCVWLFVNELITWHEPVREE